MIESKIEDKVRSKKDLRKTELRHVTIRYPTATEISSSPLCELLLLLYSIMVSYFTGTSPRSVTEFSPGKVLYQHVSPRSVTESSWGDGKFFFSTTTYGGAYVVVVMSEVSNRVLFGGWDFFFFYHHVRRRVRGGSYVRGQ